MKRFPHLELIVLLYCALTACGSRGAIATPYIPPTGASSSYPMAMPTQSPQTTPTAENSLAATIQPTSTPLCTTSLVFLEDLTIPDGSLVAPGEPLDKRWRVENNGSCNWDEGFGLQLVAGPEMGVPQLQALYPARSGTQAVIRIQFTAPSDPGTYRSAWQARDPQGTLFGDPIYIEINVEAP